jgi:hypothetical protein
VLGCKVVVALELMLVWVAMADLLVFSVLVSSSQSILKSILVSAGCCRRWFCDGVRRRLVDNVEDQPPSSSFLVFIGVTAYHFSWRHIPYLLVNEENQPFTIIMKLWKSDFYLGNISLQCLELRV